MLTPDRIQANCWADGSGLEVKNAQFLTKVVLIWFVCIASAAFCWWYTPMEQKPIWGFVLLVSILVGPFLLSSALLTVAVTLLISGRSKLSEILSHLSVILIAIGWVPLTLARIRCPIVFSNFYVVNLISNGKFKKAELVAKDMLKQREQVYAKGQTFHRTRDVCISLMTLADACEQVGKFDLAEGYLTRTSQLIHKDLGEGLDDSFQILKSGLCFDLFYALGDFYEMVFKLDQAESNYLSAIEQTRLNCSSDDLKKVKNWQNYLSKCSLGEIYAISNRLSEAEGCLDAVKPEPTASSGTLMVGWLTAMGILRIRQERLTEADELISRAVQITKKQARGLPAENIKILKAVAVLEASKQNLIESESAYKEALSLAEKVYGPNHPVTADILYGYAELLSINSKTEESIKLTSRADSIKEKVWAQLAQAD